MPADPNQLPEDLQIPRKQGEIQFEEPWQARAFGIAVLLNENGQYPWQHFSAALADRIELADAANQQPGYYQSWLEALERLAIDNGLVTRLELQQRAVEQAHAHARSHDHDH